MFKFLKVSKRLQSLLYKLHPTEKSSDWLESLECILILYFYFHHSTWFQSRHHTLQPMGKSFFISTQNYREIDHFYIAADSNRRIGKIHIWYIWEAIKNFVPHAFPTVYGRIKISWQTQSNFVILILRGRKYWNLKLIFWAFLWISLLEIVILQTKWQFGIRWPKNQYNFLCKYYDFIVNSFQETETPLMKNSPQGILIASLFVF